MKVVNVTGMCCPMPLIVVRKEITNMQKGETLQVEGDDPIFEESITDLCEVGGYEILSNEKVGSRISIMIIKV